MFKPQLAKEYDGRFRGVYDYYASPKLDGIRAVWTPETGLVTRNHQSINGLDELVAELSAVAAEHGFTMIDGELMAEGVSFDDLSGLIRNNTNIDKSLVRMHVFAVNRGGGYPATLAMISDMVAIEDAEYLVPVPYKVVQNHPDAIREACELYVAEGFEGVMLRHPRNHYTEGRGTDLLKYKIFTEADLTIIDVVEGTGKHAGKCGALVVEGEIEGEKVHCLVGTGFTDFQREQYWLGKESMVGIIAEIKYQNISKGDGEVKSLRFPSFNKLKLDR